MSLPLVIIIDLDGTIIGDISPQIASHDLAKNLKGHPGKYVFDMKQFKSTLSSGLIRPHFETFLKSLQAHYRNIEFFIYTASEKTWAEFVVKNIENVLGFKFNRPLFTRRECIVHEKDYKKGLCIVRKSIINSLKKKYGITYDKKDIASNILLIDNNNVYQGQDSKHLLLCPSYNYKVPENIPAHITHGVFVNNPRIIHSVVKRYIPYEYTEDYLTFQRNFYLLYTQHLQMVQKNNQKYVGDRFWKQLRDILISQDIRTFDERTIRFLNTNLRPQVNVVGTEVRTATTRPSTGAIYSRLQQQTAQRNQYTQQVYNNKRKDTFY